MWVPELGLRGLFKMSFLPHLTVVHGVGYGGSLVYANTLPVPKPSFFRASSWGHLADWQRELCPHYATAQRMLGATRNPHLTRIDQVFRKIATDLGRSEGDRSRPRSPCTSASLASPSPIPSLAAKGPSAAAASTAAAACSAVGTGPRTRSTRTILYLAEKRGLAVRTETEVTHVSPSAISPMRPALRHTAAEPGLPHRSPKRS